MPPSVLGEWSVVAKMEQGPTVDFPPSVLGAWLLVEEAVQRGPRAGRLAGARLRRDYLSMVPMASLRRDVGARGECREGQPE